MKTIRLTRALVMSGIVAVLAVTAGSALAAPPDIQLVNVDQTVPAPRLSAFCGFDVQRHDVFQLRIISFHDQSGNTTREMDVLPNGTATFSANGRSVVGRYSGMDTFTFNQDGTTTHLSVGPNIMVVLPGVGPVWGGSGAIRIVLDSGGNIISYTSNGPDFSNPAVCGALAP